MMIDSADLNTLKPTKQQRGSIIRRRTFVTPLNPMDVQAREIDRLDCMGHQQKPKGNALILVVPILCLFLVGVWCLFLVGGKDV